MPVVQTYGKSLTTDHGNRPDIDNTTHGVDFWSWQMCHCRTVYRTEISPG